MKLTIKNTLTKKQIVILIAIISVIILMLSYLLSYSFVLPLFEKANLNSIGYAIYGPTETLRNNNTFYWKLTEKCYHLMGGNVDSIKRANSPDSLRRRILFHDNNSISSDYFFTNYGEKIIKGTKWYDNGKIELYTEEDEQGNCITESWNEEGKLMQIDTSDKRGNGQLISFNNEGQQIAVMVFKNFAPWNGEFLADGKKVLYKNGKIVNK